MAECTAYSSIVVSDAGDVDARGTYLPVPATIGEYSYTKWVKEGGGYEIILSAGGPFYFWLIRIPPGGPNSFTRYRDYETTPSVTDINEMICPTQGQWFVAAGESPGPTITGVAGGGGPSEPTFGLPAGVVAQMVAAHGSVANFLRLRNQGQI